MANVMIGRMKIAGLMLVGLACIALSITGCSTQYVDPRKPILGVPDKVTMYDLESAAQELMSRLRASDAFADCCKSVQREKGSKPIITLAYIENKLEGVRVQDRLDSIRDSIITELLRTGFIEVDDDEARNKIAARIIRGIDEGHEDGSLLPTFGTLAPPDFLLGGDFRQFVDPGGYNTYRLRLTIYNMKTRRPVWQEIETRIKL